jgi:hypothetical protein
MGFDSCRFVIDAILMIAVVAFVMRSLRNPGAIGYSRRMNELEGSLKMLIREATSAGTNLNDELITRSKELERLLSEVADATIKATHSRDSALHVMGDLQAFKRRLIELGSEIEELSSSTRTLGERLNSAMLSGEIVEKAPQSRNFSDVVRVGNSISARQNFDRKDTLIAQVEKQHTTPQLQSEDLPHFEMHTFQRMALGLRDIKENIREATS